MAYGGVVRGLRTGKSEGGWRRQSPKAQRHTNPNPNPNPNPNLGFLFGVGFAWVTSNENGG